MCYYKYSDKPGKSPGIIFRSDSMPYKPLSPCRQPGCKELTADRYCSKHALLHTREVNAKRESANTRGYSSKWRKARANYLLHHPLCIECERQGRYVQATVVDHMIPHKGDKKLFWDTSNWQPLCKRCHDQKTAREDGGFGNSVKNKR